MATPRWAVSADAAAVLEKAGGTKLASAIGAIHRSNVSLQVLRNLGITTASGVRLRDCVSGAEAAKARREIRAALITAKPNTCSTLSSVPVSADNHEADRANVVDMIVAAIGDELRRLDTPAAGGTLASVVTLEKEEEQSFSNPKYTNDDVKGQILMVLGMYNMVVRSKQLPQLKEMKKISFYVKTAATWPDPERLKLEAYRREATDRPITLFAREVWGVVVVAAAEAVPAGKRDDGAGKKTGSPAQWANANVARAMLGELDDLRDSTPDDLMTMVVKQMRSALHRGTDLGNETASLAMQTQISRVSEYITVRKDTRAGLKRRQPATPDKASAEDSDEPMTEERKSRKKRLKFKDVEGVKGPGGQVRMKGGNPKGKPCAAFAKGKCNFNTCPFSHAKKAS